MALEPNQQPQPLPPRPLGAQHSREETFVFFLNTTQRLVTLYWLDFNGRQEFFFVLKPGAGIKANTFVTHPWIFRDALTGERMHVKHQDIFWPQLYRVRDHRNVGQWITLRKLIAIHPPVQTLRTKCLWRLAELMYGRAAGSLETTCLPRTLKNDLSSILALIQHYRTSSSTTRR